MTLAPARGRTLVLGDPIVSLGDQTLIPDGALIVEGPAIVAAGPRDGPRGTRSVRPRPRLDRTLRDARFRELPLPLRARDRARSVSVHLRARQRLHPGGHRRCGSGGPVRRGALGARQRPEGRADRDGRHVLRPSRHARLRVPSGARRLRGHRDAHGVRTGESRREHLRARAERAVPGTVAGRPRRRGPSIADGLRVAGRRRDGVVRASARRVARTRRPVPHRDRARLDTCVFRRTVPAVPGCGGRARHGDDHPRARDAFGDVLQPRAVREARRCSVSPTSTSSRRRPCSSTSCG